MAPILDDNSKSDRLTMATPPFRPPQFSDDVAWLPPWLQSPTTPLQCDDDHNLFPLSLQNVDSIKGGNSQAKDSNLILSGESVYKPPYNICRLYLSGEDSSPITLTPCEKVLHLNLHLSTDGPSSINSTQAWDTSQNYRLSPPENKALDPVKALNSPKVNRASNMDNNTSNINLSPPDETKKTLYNTKNSEPENLETHNTKATECNDINDAVELSIAASEALVIHEILQSESMPEAMSSTAILEVSLRVKQARVEGLQETLCFSKDTDNTYDIVSDLGDSDLEDVYNDVGLSISSLGYMSSMDPSVSRVKDTPMTHIHPEGEREVQSEWNQDQEIHFQNRSLARPLDNSLDADKAKDSPNVSFDIKKSSGNALFDSILGTSCHLENEMMDNIQMNQGDTNDRMGDDHLIQRELKSSLQLLHSGKTNYIRESGGSSCGYQSRWLGGWSAKEGDIYGEKESNKAKTVCKMLINEASYLSESTYVAPDQNSVMVYHQSCSNFLEANNSLEDSWKTAAKQSLISQDVVKDSNSSSVDPFCSMVPCSISPENVKSRMVTKDNDCPRRIIAGKNLSQTSPNQNSENIGEKEHTVVNLGDDCVNPILRRQTKSLKEYSKGLPGNSPPPLKQSFNHGLEEGKSKGVLLCGVENLTCNNSINTNDLMNPFLVESMPGCASAKLNEDHENIRLLAVDPHISCTKTSNEMVNDQQPLFRSTVSYISPTKSQENHFSNSVETHLEDHSKGIDENQAHMHVCMQDLPKSPLVLRHRTRRFRAPKLPVTDLPTGTQTEEQVCGSKNIYHKNGQVPEGQSHCLSHAEISRKRVRFLDADIKPRSNKSLKRTPPLKRSRVINRLGHIAEDQGITSQEVKERLTSCRLNGRKKAIFQGLNFLLTGFSKKKEQDIEGLLRKHGGMVLSDVPTPLPRPSKRRSSRSYSERLPVIICSRKLQATKFLYGCAANAFVLKAGWAYDSIKAGSVLPPDKYEVVPNRVNTANNEIGKSISHNDVRYIFVEVGIVLHGTHSFCTKFAKVIKHGQGLVYKSLQWLVQSLDKKKISHGALVVEEENRATRHLKKYASEQKIPVLPASWIVNSLLEGKLLPLQEKFDSWHPPRPAVSKVPAVPVLQDWSQEI